MNEEMHPIRRNFWKRKTMPEYLATLNKLFLVEVSEQDILPFEESDKVFSVTANETDVRLSPFLFTDKEKLAKFWEQLPIAPVYAVINMSEQCGVVKICNVKDFNLQFAYEDEPFGYLYLVDLGLKNWIYLDYYEERNQHFLQIHLFGEEWKLMNI